MPGHRRRRGRTALVAAIAAGGLAAAVAGGVALATDAPATESGRPDTARVLAAPEAAGEEQIAETRQISGTFDGENKRFTGAGALGGDGQEEGQDPIFELADGAVLKNVILGAPAADGIHCLGSCTLENVFWEDVGEDAATFLGTSENATYVVSGGGATKAEDKVFQFNGAGTLTVRDFEVSDFGKLVRSCGNCSEQVQRDVVLENITVTAPGDELVGINSNFGDTARLSGITIVGDPDREIVPCQKFEGVTDGEPEELDSEADGVNCVFQESDITFR
ncbi:pectate lyase [Streptomyces aurantiogriseus]|uniref:Pectate lyase n=1 Tax=Streptomyces aurantiogriseus TaxID=66870 RepID=A0A918CIH2_9ACTN|nr:pectate lyase [Streptomyces aurantiogriseus]GGR25668.1 pectate lyase [Streptomyces aurantiogriseus]